MSLLTAQWDNRTDYLLQQSFFYLLLQDYSLMVISGLDFTPWTNRFRPDALQEEDRFYILLENNGRISLAGPPADVGFVG